jgi:hypothetical protein
LKKEVNVTSSDMQIFLGISHMENRQEVLESTYDIYIPSYAPTSTEKLTRTRN